MITENDTKDMLAEAMYQLSRAEIQTISIDDLLTCQVASPGMVTAHIVGAGYRKVPTKRGNTVLFSGELYLGKRDGWIVKLEPIKTENRAPDGNIIGTIEIPLTKIREHLDTGSCMNMAMMIVDHLKTRTIVQEKKKINRDKAYKDKKYGAWA